MIDWRVRNARSHCIPGHPALAREEGSDTPAGAV
jgi:hypothetical protein